MKAIETTALVAPDGTLTAHVQNVPPGEHRVVVVIEDTAERSLPEDSSAPAPELPLIHAGSWPKDLTLRRVDMYGDDGR